MLSQGPLGGSNGNGGGSGGTQQTPPSQGSSFRQGTVIFLKGVAIWVPAVLFWVSLVWGGSFLDQRTPEEMEEEEAEVRRLERFYDVDQLPDEEYLNEWTSKDEALSKIVDKLLRSQRFLDCMLAGSSGAAASTEADAIEVSYVLPPVSAFGGPRPWSPRLVIAHRLGSLALVSVSFKRVPGSKDQEERWACVALRADLISQTDGEPTCEPICDMRGPVPHGVRYMRI